MIGALLEAFVLGVAVGWYLRTLGPQCFDWLVHHYFLRRGDDA